MLLTCFMFSVFLKAGYPSSHISHPKCFDSLWKVTFPWNSVMEKGLSNESFCRVCVCHYHTWHSCFSFSLSSHIISTVESFPSVSSTIKLCFGRNFPFFILMTLVIILCLLCSHVCAALLFSVMCVCTYPMMCEHRDLLLYSYIHNQPKKIQTENH